VFYVPNKYILPYYARGHNLLIQAMLNEALYYNSDNFLTNVGRILPGLNITPGELMKTLLRPDLDESIPTMLSVTIFDNIEQKALF
jgi:hypothetical protein